LIAKTTQERGTQLIRTALIVGSANDEAFVREHCLRKLADTVGYDFSVCSADRNPQELRDLVSESLDTGIDLFICYAGLSPALPRAVAALAYYKPVIGVCENEDKGDQQAITNTPPGLPVIYVGAGKNGLIKAAELAILLLGWKHPDTHSVQRGYVASLFAKKPAIPHKERYDPEEANVA
jgi:phosphoribosylcarboxyaminoimidazole (NCAIR) mutase